MRVLPDTVARQQTLSNANVASGGDAVLNVAADPEQYVVIDWIVFGYETAPTGGFVVVNDVTNSNELFRVPVTAEGTGELVFGERGFVCPKGSEVNIILEDGSADKSINAQVR